MSPELLLRQPSSSLSPPQLFAPLAHAHARTVFICHCWNLKSEKLTSFPNTTVPGKMTMRRKSPPIGVSRIGNDSKKKHNNGLISASLDLSEDNVKLVLADAREEFPQIFDTSVGMTGVAELAEVDGPFVRIRLKGRFWHERSLVLARLGNYLKQRIPEILEVDIEDEKQLDDSPANF